MNYIRFITAFLFLNCMVFADKDFVVPNSYTTKEWKTKEGGNFLYRTAKPTKLAKGKKYPLLVFLHGAGGRGNDNIKQLLDAGGVEAFEKQKLRTLRESHVFAGQVPSGERWVDVGWNLLNHRMPKISESMKMTFEAMDAYVRDGENQVDPNRIYVMGLSMGGYGTWDALQRRPGFFAAAVPICGGGDASYAEELASTPIWAWHGEKDKVIKPMRSREMINSIRKAGGSPKYTEIRNRGHNSWVEVWNSQELWDWLYSQKKG